MRPANITINRDFSSQIFVVGDEKTRILVLDNVLLEPQAMVDCACDHAKFEAEETSRYPGLRARLPQSYVATLLPVVDHMLTNYCDIPKGLKLACRASFFSLVTLQPEELSAEQRIPHFDSSDPCYFAVTQYLNEGDFGGTTFYRHRPTRFENISESRQRSFLQSAQKFNERVAQAERPGYINGSDEHFKALGSIRYRHNRLVMYPGSLLHSGNIERDRDISADPRTGRLTANLFVHFK